ncbi:myosin-binding protein 3-like [Zingiber officinale]|uniref:GTD-binding domain-containing protein n=1 Tax=Zingiber officinale TaxID=94328 RepID=A0A8J5BXK0_ZINOF|nr:myosin-binding protein 3-like [Zingiber officinale]KAG6468816.1 hypothetical protein ZIOFF_073509 [Zingiber officinale]
MAANKFAVFLHRNTHKMTTVLVYAVLEWTLIVLLLLNGLFAYLIVRFAAFFRLQPPCVFCSRVDHLFEKDDAGRRTACRDLVCSDHAAEVSGLGYCERHRRLAEVGEMCEDCCPTSSRSADAAAVLAWIKRNEEEEKDLRCSCCGVALESRFRSPHLFKQSRGLTEYEQTGDLIEFISVDGQRDLEKDATVCGEKLEEWRLVSPHLANRFTREEEMEKNEEYVGGGDAITALDSMKAGEEESSLIQLSDACLLVDDPSEEVVISTPMYICAEEDRLVPVELIDSTTKIPLKSVLGEDEQKQLDDVEAEEKRFVASDLDVWKITEKESVLISADGNSVIIQGKASQVCNADTLDTRSIPQEQKSLISKEMNESSENTYSDMGENQQCSISLDKRSISEEEKTLPSAEESSGSIEVDIFVVMAEAIEGISEEINGAEHCFITHDIGNISEEEKVTTIITLEDVDVQAKIVTNEKDLSGTKDANCDVSIGSAIYDSQHFEDEHLQIPILLSKSMHDQDFLNNNEKNTMEPGHISVSSENNEIEERAPETPTYIDGIYVMNKRFLIGRRELGTESTDGSVTSEFEGWDTLNVDQLKASLQAERKTLSTLYAELEEERSASAIAANQTMAMITRLQEEKAAMQMEALQYQRMMEEQSEYDQEALHLLNEMMMKREKEKQELEKELEIYKRKVLRYEVKERRQIGNHVNGRYGASSVSSTAQDSDDLSFETHERDELVDDPDENHQSIPADDLLSSGTDQGTTKHLLILNESLADFEEERLSILEQLMELERKLITKDDEDPQNSESIMEGDMHDYMNGFSNNLEAGRKLQDETRSMGCQGKKLLPLFDALNDENEDDVCTKDSTVDGAPETLSNPLGDQQNLAIVEEVDNLYDRLDALEGDRDFLKHCINSLNKGDKGIHLLQEILEHLHDLRSMELRATNSFNVLASSP